MAFSAVVSTQVPMVTNYICGWCWHGGERWWRVSELC